MTEKLASKDVTLMFGTVALADGEPEVEVPHAAAMIAIAPTHAITAICLWWRNLSPLLLLPVEMVGEQNEKAR
ncbi:MAG TPA: hypothetical protein VET26_02090 [Candidatus Sulfotelmatobacter sp.]|nr:hypothetical protein [Candidatus Sulfotelmatobacter sp.]